MNEKLIRDYEKLTYTSLLGKVIGVYLGKNQEGWTKEAIEKRYGLLDHYTHVGEIATPDDDISGPLTFIRALEDSEEYENTSPEFFGKTWLNYLIENRTILWWGGMSISTEHTAYLRLKKGIPSPKSGSAELNGKIVAEQIGGQIFIDCFGMVAPGNPGLAVELAKRAASVSHDGEAVYAAQVVAAMVAAAYTEKSMDRILDLAVRFIPEDSLIAQVHRDVRAWVREDGDWRRTHGRIVEKYGYDLYGGCCHVIPNHAIMVMAWAYGQNDFFKTMTIINTSGWDTDCNSGNCGAVSALVAGLEHLCDTYDFLSPVADRLIVCSGESTLSCSDILTQALFVASIGRKVMHWPEAPIYKNGASHHFEMPYSTQGFRVDPEFSGGAVVRNVAAPLGFLGERALEVTYRSRAHVVAPTSAGYFVNKTWYALSASSWLYPGMTVRVKGMALSAALDSTVSLFVTVLEDFDSPVQTVLSPSVRLVSGEAFEIEWQIPEEFAIGTICSMGFETNGGGAKFLIDTISHFGKAVVRPEGTKVFFSTNSHDIKRCMPLGWISSVDYFRGNFWADKEADIIHFCKNEGIGLFVTGNREWKDTQLSVRLKIQAADSCGIVLRYQGLLRYYAIRFNKTELQIVRNFYGETILASTDWVSEYGDFINLTAEVKGESIRVCIDGKEVVEVADGVIADGGAGMFVESGVAGFKQLEIVGAS